MFNIHTAANIDADELSDIFEYRKWDDIQLEAGKRVRAALSNAFAVIVKEVPPCPDRSVALRKLRDCRMDCNSAIT